MKLRSPMLVPQERGRTFRFVLAGLFVILGVCIIFGVTHGLLNGRMFAKYSKYGVGSYVMRAEHPNAFWIATGVNTSLGIWILYIAAA